MIVFVMSTGAMTTSWLTTVDGKPCAVKVACTVWSGGKDGDNFKFLPIAIVIMTPAQMFAPMIAETNRKIEARIGDAVNLDIQLFNNAVSVPGTSILPLLQDAETNKLAVMVQTRAQRGLVVNYGPQLRSPQATGVGMANPGTTGITGSVTDFERNYVTTAVDFFVIERADTGVKVDEGAPSAGSAWAMGAGAGIIDTGDARTRYASLTADDAIPAGNDLTTMQPFAGPVVNFWDPFTQTYEIAAGRARTYSATGYLFTPNMLRTNMPSNNNLSYAQTPGSPYYINAGSNYHVTFIVDSTHTVVGIYVEEHGCDASVAFLAAAMLQEGYISEAIQFQMTTP